MFDRVERGRGEGLLKPDEPLEELVEKTDDAEDADVCDCGISVSETAEDCNISVPETVASAFGCFGVNEEKADKWLRSCVKIWYYLISLFWFLLSALTFAPIVFISNKVNVIFKNKRKSIFCGTIIHLLFVAFVVFLFVS